MIPPPSERKPLPYAMIGIGGYGATRRALLRNTGAFRMIGGVSGKDVSIADLEREEGGPLKAYATMEELVADPESAAVFIATPAHLHLEQAWLAARAGKAFFVEKPLGHDLAECRRLVEYCESNNIPHGHGFSARYAPIWQEVKRIVDRGGIGRVVSAAATAMHTGGLAFEPGNWRFAADRNPGGPLFQCGIHKIDLLRFLFGEGFWTSGLVHRQITRTPTDDAYVLTGRFGGIPVTLHCHYVASYRHGMEIYGTSGALFVTQYPDRLEYKQTDVATGREAMEEITPRIPVSNAEREALCDFADAVRERRQPAMNGREGLTSLELVFAAAAISQEITD
jgi:predicted dehydrogenase